MPSAASTRLRRYLLAWPGSGLSPRAAERATRAVMACLGLGGVFFVLAAVTSSQPGWIKLVWAVAGGAELAYAGYLAGIRRSRS